MENPPRRLTLYTTLIGDGQRADLAGWINRDLLIGDWPKIRMLTAGVLVRAWESWAQTWAGDLRARLTSDDTPDGAVRDRVDWDDYLDDGT